MKLRLTVGVLPAVPHPAPKILVQVMDNLVQRLAIVARREPPHPVLEALSGLGTDYVSRTTSGSGTRTDNTDSSAAADTGSAAALEGPMVATSGRPI